MRSLERMFGAVLVLCAATGSTVVAVDGAVPVRIPVPDGVESRCVTSKDHVWITLRRVITEKQAKWLTADASIQTLFSAQVRGKGKNPLTFPLTSEASLEAYTKGQVSIPIEYTLVDGFALDQGDWLYSGIQLDMTFLNLKKKTAWGNALQALSQIAKKLPIPNNPATQAATYLLDFANSAVDADIKAVNEKDKIKSASLAFNFDPSGKCDSSTDFERTGTVAVVQASGDPSGLLVKIGEINNYCWSAELKPSFVLKAAKNDGTTCSDTAHYRNSFRQISNNYVGFFVNALESTKQAGPSEKADADREHALARCRANGVPGDKCVAIH